MIAASMLGVVASSDPTSLYHYYGMGIGPVFGGLLFALGAITVFLILIQSWACRPSRGVPSDVADPIRTYVDERDFETLSALCEGEPSLLAQVLAAGLRRLPCGLDAARIAAHSHLEVLRRDREFAVFLLRLIVVTAPLLGVVAASTRVSTALMALEAEPWRDGPPTEAFFYLVGQRLTPLLPAAAIALIAAVASFTLKVRHEATAVRVRVAVENILMDITQETGASVRSTVIPATNELQET